MSMTTTARSRRDPYRAVWPGTTVATKKDLTTYTDPEDDGFITRGHVLRIVAGEAEVHWQIAEITTWTPVGDLEVLR